VITAAIIAAHVAALVAWPILLVGVINRVKARWAGRRGPPLWQLGFDLWRLLRKDVVRSRPPPRCSRSPWIVLAARWPPAWWCRWRAGAAGFRYDLLLFTCLAGSR
jgi:formate hydrogenlyase subunit 4